MTDDGRRKPPPRAPSPDDEVVVIPPDTERSGMKPLPPEPFKLLAPPKWAVALIDKVDAVYKRQQQMALQLDGFGKAQTETFISYEKRVDTFHQELALLRATVTGDHAPRLGMVEDKVEKLSPQQKAKVAAVITAKLGAYGTGVLFIGGIVLRALAKKFPEYGELIESVLGMVGL